MRNCFAILAVAVAALGMGITGVAGAATGGNENVWPHLTCYNEGRIIGAGGFAASGGLTYKLRVSADYGDELREQVIPAGAAPLTIPLRLEAATGMGTGTAVLTSAPTSDPARETELDRQYYQVPCVLS